MTPSPTQKNIELMQECVKQKLPTKRIAERFNCSISSTKHFIEFCRECGYIDENFHKRGTYTTVVREKIKRYIPHITKCLEYGIPYEVIAKSIDNKIKRGSIFNWVRDNMPEYLFRRGKMTVYSCYKEGYSPELIAEKCGISLNAVYDAIDLIESKKKFEPEEETLEEAMERVQEQEKAVTASAPEKVESPGDWETEDLKKALAFIFKAHSNRLLTASNRNITVEAMDQTVEITTKMTDIENLLYGLICQEEKR